MSDLVEICGKISEEKKADIYIYNAPITYSNVDQIITLIRDNKEKKENIILVLTTFGGDPDASFRLVEFIKKSYKCFTLFVVGHCKSAGTLVALGANEIVMFDFGELGPLDVQLSKEDELTNTSGLSLRQAMMVLRDEAFSMFEDCFLKLKGRSGGSITTRTAAEISSTLVTGLFAPIFAQIDPLRLGEIERSMKIAIEYGRRITDNMTGILQLVTGYVSHSFVIDFNEAKTIFNDVRQPTDEEILFEGLIFNSMRAQDEKPIIMKAPCLQEKKENKEDGNTEPKDDIAEEETAKPDGND